MEINANSGQNVYEMYKSITFCNLVKKIVKNNKYRNIAFSQTYIKLVVMATSKTMDT